MNKVDAYVAHLKTLEWFSNVGRALPADLSSAGVDRVESWDQAIKWCQQDISFWCRIEAGNLLMSDLRTKAPTQFSKWNDIARYNLPFAKQLLEFDILPRVPEPYRESAQKFILSQVIGVLTEVAFSDFSSISSLKNQFIIYERGFFPCGWRVDSPESFPEKAIVMVY